LSLTISSPQNDAAKEDKLHRVSPRQPRKTGGHTNCGLTRPLSKKETAYSAITGKAGWKLFEDRKILRRDRYKLQEDKVRPAATRPRTRDDNSASFRERQFRETSFGSERKRLLETTKNLEIEKEDLKIESPPCRNAMETLLSMPNLTKILSSRNGRHKERLHRLSWEN
jgi:hypothetical protein